MTNACHPSSSLSIPLLRSSAHFSFFHIGWSGSWSCFAVVVYKAVLSLLCCYPLSPSVRPLHLPPLLLLYAFDFPEYLMLVYLEGFSFSWIHCFSFISLHCLNLVLDLDPCDHHKNLLLCHNMCVCGLFIIIIILILICNSQCDSTLSPHNN